MADRTRKSRVFTISMPSEMAEMAEAIAKREGRTMSELFRECFRAYRAQAMRRALAEMGEYGDSRNPHGYTEEDVPRLIQEVRAEMLAKQEAAEQERAELASSNR